MTTPGLRAKSQTSAIKNNLMEIHKRAQGEEGKVFVHYDHSDPCNLSRWTAKDCFEYMYARPWEVVNQFYSELVNGHSSLQELFGTGWKHNENAEAAGSSDEYSHISDPSEDQRGKWARVTFKIVLSYAGKSFDGWQKQPGLTTVQGLVERSIGTFVDDDKARKLKEKGLPVEGITVVAGRTDKGVTALNQVCSFYTWRKNIQEREIEDAINNAAPGKLRVISVSQVFRTFHPNFCAKWRRYFYIFPLVEGEERKQTDQIREEKESQMCYENQIDPRNEQGEYFAEETMTKDTINGNTELVEDGKKPTPISVVRVDQLLRQLEGKLLSYKMYARDTKASRNAGPPTECFLYHARATEAQLPCLDHASSPVKVICVELVANRFLRKMVRVLVATVIREVAAGAQEDILLKLMDATCRRATAPPAPPDGLCLFDVGYEEFDRRKCFIS